MVNNHFEKPLYPNSDYPGQEQENQTQNQNNMFGNFSNLFSGLSQNNTNPLLSMLLGLKGGNNMFSKLGEGNPLMQMFSSMSNVANKKESETAPKKMPEEEFFT